MTPDAPSLKLSVIDDIGSVEPTEWNRLAGDEGTSPFLEHAFLSSLETSGCATPEQGWYPRHFLLRDGDRLVAAAPAYARTHSMGDFIFDQGLAQAAMDMGREYYPKLVATVPFTPSPGYRFLIDSDYPEDEITTILLSGMKAYAEAANLHSVSVLFAAPEWDALPRSLAVEEDVSGADGGTAWHSWVHQYFLLDNSAYKSFEDYLSRFDKNQRRNIRRERASINDAGIHIDCVSGDGINRELMDRMFDFYEDTNRQFGPWAAFFLNQDWFRIIAETWKDRLVLFLARRDGDSSPLAMSFCVRNGSRLIGRYWGAGEFVKNLHFELCYYAPIEYAISEKIQHFDPGMGSPHKARRGFASREFFSYHRFADTEISSLFSSVLPEANRVERENIAALDSSVPWRSNDKIIDDDLK